MIEYSSTTTFESRKFPGISYILRRMSHGGRMELHQKAAVIFQKIGELSSALSVVEEEIKRAEDVAKQSPCICDDESHEHDEATKRCKSPGCKCRLPEPDESIGSYSKQIELQVKLVEVLNSELYPAYVKWGVRKVQGLKIDGKDPDADDLVNLAPEGMVAEVGEEIGRLIRLSPEELLGFKLPTTNGAVVDRPGSTDQPIAPPVKENSTT